VPPLTGNTFNWTCSGQNGGTTATCSADFVPTCSGPVTTTWEAPTPKCDGTYNGIVVSGTTVAVTATPNVTYPGNGTGSLYCQSNGTWTSGSGPITCIINGVCGSDDGQALINPPTNLCSVGVASALSGTWNWSCAGENGGTNAICSAAPPTCQSLGYGGTTRVLGTIQSSALWTWNQLNLTRGTGWVFSMTSSSNQDHYWARCPNI